MRKYNSLLVLALIMLASTGLCNNNADLPYVRRAYLVELGIPPSVSEIEWLMTYETNTRIAGIEYVLSKKYGTAESEVKKNKRAIYVGNGIAEKKPLTSTQQNFILRYQAGNLKLTTEEAKRCIVNAAVNMAEVKEDPIDYLSLCLCGKYTNTEEYVVYNKIYTTTVGDEYTKLNAVLSAMLVSNTFLYY